MVLAEGLVIVIATSAVIFYIGFVLNSAGFTMTRKRA